MYDTHGTAPTRHVQVDGEESAYSRWGNAASRQPPLLFLQHFRGGMDHRDPLITDGLVAGRKLMRIGPRPRGGNPDADPTSSPEVIQAQIEASISCESPRRRTGRNGRTGPTRS